MNPYWPLAEPDGLGVLLGADDVRDAVRSTLDTWSAYYLAVLSARLVAANRIGPTGPLNAQSQPIIPAPLSGFGTWLDEPNFRSIGTGMPAAYLVRSPGTPHPPQRKGDGTWVAVYAATVEVQVFGLDWQTTADVTSWYEKAVRWAIAQQKSLGGLSQATKWAGTAYDGIGHSSTRTEGRAVIRFDITVPGVLDDTRGPATLPAQPWTPPPGDPTVLTEIVTIAKTPLPSPLPAPPADGSF